jgi:glycosyltransferase domain-containing protein
VDLTIIVPTLGRPELLVRLIRYYDLIGFTGEIVIGDGSTEADYQRVNKELSLYAARLRIKHLSLPGYSVADAVRVCNQHVESSFACLIGDDDFIVPKTAASCIKFLEKYSDYVAAHGLGILVGASDGRPQAIESAHFYVQTIREEESAKERLIAHLNSYSVSLFSVHRIEVWRRMFSGATDVGDVTNCDDKTFSDELLPCCLSVSLGKIGQVEGLYLVRQVHGKRYILPTWFLWICNEKWHPSYVYFRNLTSKVIANIDNLPIADAEKIIDVAFSGYLMRQVSCREKPANFFAYAIVKSAISHLPFARNIWRRIIALGPASNSAESISLAGLKQRSSPYFNDFQAILIAICR